MKKTTKILTAILVLVLTFSIFTIPASAAEFNFEGGFPTQTFEENFSTTAEEIIETKQNEYTAFQYEAEKSREEHKAEREALWEEIERENDARDTFVTIFAIIAVLVALTILIAEILFIFNTAPKCGMTRLWALVPLFSRFFGLLVCIAVFTNHNKTSPKNVKICPRCNCKQPNGSTVCSICGETL